jgi:hypothetical protein
MRLRRLFLLLLGLAALAAVFVRFRAPRRPRELVEVYFEDGSSVPFAGDTPEGERLLSLAAGVRASAS